MTIGEAITRVDALKPNGFSPDDKIGWLSIVDGLIDRNIIQTHELPFTPEEDEETEEEQEAFAGYTSDTPLDTELIAYFPYDDLYIAWLESKIDYSNGEYERYNNSVTRFNDLYSAYQNDYNRHHMPLQKNEIKFFRKRGGDINEALNS